MNIHEGEYVSACVKGPGNVSSEYLYKVYGRHKQHNNYWL